MVKDEESNDKQDKKAENSKEKKRSKSSDKSEKENKAAEQPDLKDKATVVASDVVGNIEESTEEVVYNKREKLHKEREFSFWTADQFFHDTFSDHNILVRYALEILIFAVLALSIPIGGAAYFAKNELKLHIFFAAPSPGENEWIFMLRRNLFFVLWYSADTILQVITECSTDILARVLFLIDLDKSEFCWSLVQIFNITKDYMRVCFSFFFAFSLSNIMFDPYDTPALKFALDENIMKAIVLWISIYAGMLFIVKFLVNVFTSDIKREVYKESIRDLNYQVFIFKKLKIISENYQDKEEIKRISSNMMVGYDPGLYLKDRSFFISKEDAETVAMNILALMKVKTLSYEEIKAYFPDNYEQVFKYLGANSSDSTSNPKPLKLKHLKNSVRELFQKRKDMARTLRDRDSLFGKLDLVFAMITSYGALVVLLSLFKADYKLFMASFGTSFITISWVFADSIKNIYNCFLFLLVVRPYDIGDRVTIDNENLIVYRVDLLNTTFLTSLQKITYIPNGTLFTTKIYNIARSPPQSCTLEVGVGDDTTYEKALNLEKYAKEELKKTTRYFVGCTLCSVVTGKLTYTIEHTKNFQNFTLNRIKQDSIANVFVKAMGKAGISYTNSFIFKE